MKIYYSISANLVLTDSEINKKISLLKQAGVTHINLLGYFWGHFESPIDHLVQAREILQREGFEVGIISVPVGHPGNSIDPSDPNFDLQIPSHWRYRINKKGNPIYYCADIEEKLIHDNATVVQELVNNGFQLIFLDDDCRLGNWGSEIQGCFCSDCIETFNIQYHRKESLKSLASAVQLKTDKNLLTDWVEFTCRKIIRLFEVLNNPSVNIGLMIMHCGDERHGIDVIALRHRFPNLLFRIGEVHFEDKHFESPKDKVDELMGMMGHLNMMDPALTFSETTSFPMNELSPDNLVYKAKMALVLGIPNIYLMNGLGFLEDRYWECFKDQASVLQSLASVCLSEEPFYPLHLLAGTHGALGESIQKSPLPILAGLPIKPVRADQVENGAEILFILGKFMVTPEWEKQLNKYRLLIFDLNSFQHNKSILKRLSDLPYHILNASFFDCFKSESVLQDQNITMIRKLILNENPLFPFLQSGKNIGLIWRAKQNVVILMNLIGGLTKKSSL